MWSLFLHLSDRYLIGMALWLAILIWAPRWLLKQRRLCRENPRRRRYVHAALSLWFILGTLTSIELGFALLYDTTDSFDMTNVSHRWFEVHVQPDLKPLIFKDGSGIEYRDDVEFPTLGAMTSEQRTHLCFLGDSFTFGHGVPDVRNRFSNLLRRSLNDQTPSNGRYIVSNLSKPGSDLLWSEAVLKQLSDAGHQLDVAFYVMCLNDIEMFHDQRMDFNNELSALRARPQFFLWKDTYFFNWAYYRTVLLAHSGSRNYYDFVRDYYASPAWPQFESALVRMRDHARQHRTRLVVVVFPFLHNLGANYPFEPIHQQITNACRNHDIESFDLLPVLNPHSQERLTVNPFDAHPNERAQSLVAIALHDFVQRASAVKFP